MKNSGMFGMGSAFDAFVVYGNKYPNPNSKSDYDNYFDEDSYDEDDEDEDDDFEEMFD